MSTPTIAPIRMSASDLRMLSNIMSPEKRSEYDYQGCRIIVEELGGTYDYEILTQDPCFFRWHMWHSDQDFESEEQARKEAENWIENWEPNDDFFAQ